MREKRCFHFVGGGRESLAILKLCLGVEKLVILRLRDGQKSPWVSLRLQGRVTSLLGVNFRPGGVTNSNLRVTSRFSGVQTVYLGLIFGLQEEQRYSWVSFRPGGKGKGFLGNNFRFTVRAKRFLIGLVPVLGR